MSATYSPNTVLPTSVAMRHNPVGHLIYNHVLSQHCQDFDSRNRILVFALPTTSGATDQNLQNNALDMFHCCRILCFLSPS